MNGVIPLYDYGGYGYKNPYINRFSSLPIIETPEAILARINPKKTFRLLENMSMRKHQERINEIGASVMNTYLNGLNSEDRIELRECEFEEVENRNIFGIVTRRGMKFTFRR